MILARQMRKLLGHNDGDASAGVIKAKFYNFVIWTFNVP